MNTQSQTLNPWALPPIPPAQPSPFPASEVSTAVRNSTQLFSRAWNWFRDRQKACGGGKRLHVAATASLGEKRFVAVIEVDGQQFLVGGAASSVVLLAQLKPNQPFGDVLEKTIAAPAQAATAEPEYQSGRADYKPEAVPAPIAFVQQPAMPSVKKPRKSPAKPVEKASLKWIANMAAKRTTRPAELPSTGSAIKAAFRQANAR
jgi:hypothetical protein